MAKAAFIDTPYIYKFTIIETNVDADLILKFIWKAQDLNIQSAVGQNLYTKLINDCPNFVGDYRTLVVDYIQPCLAEWVVYHALPFINFRLTNKAVSTKSSDNSLPSTADDIRLKDYIRNNPSSFPEYYTRTLSFEINPSKTAYFSGIYTEGRNYGPPPASLNNIDPCEWCD
jgi:hypothetical protein